jgi:hypothetical protein
MTQDKSQRRALLNTAMKLRFPYPWGISSSASYPMSAGGGALSSGVKRLGREADHSHPCSAEVKNAWRYASTPPKRFHGVMLS